MSDLSSKVQTHQILCPILEGFKMIIGNYLSRNFGLLLKTLLKGELPDQNKVQYANEDDCQFCHNLVVSPGQLSNCLLLIRYKYHFWNKN